MAEENSGVETLKRDLLGANQTITKLQERIERLENENREYKDKYRDVDTEFKKEKDKFDEVFSHLKEDVFKLTQEKIQLKNNVDDLKRKIGENEELSRHDLQQLQIAWDNDKSLQGDRYKALEVRYNLIADFQRDKTNLEADRIRLVDELDTEKKDKLRLLADKDREKVQATDKLKKEMLHKIQETKTSLLALKKEQLKTTTRLTVLQNHQLTTELEYQSKQTEKLLFKNAKLQEQVTTLKRDVEIHKQVEAELAKRSHYAQSLIKKMSERIKELESENGDLKSPQNDDTRKSTTEEGGKGKDELVTFLEKNLEATEKKLAKLQNDYDILKNEYEFLELKVEASNNKFANAAILLKENLDMLISEDGKPDVEVPHLDLREIKGRPIEDLDSGQKQLLLNVLLEQIKPYLDKKMLANKLYEVERSTSVGGSHSKLGGLQLGQNLLPNIHEKSLENKLEQNKFHDVPLEVSARIVRSNLREWGKHVPLPATVNNKQRYKYKL